MLSVLPLGGLGEIGKNCMALVDGHKAILIDCGVSFGGRDFGIDVVHPLFQSLEDLELCGLVVTHGHEDHIGAIPYLLERFDIPIFGPKYALELISARSHEHEMLRHARMTVTTPRQAFNIGSFRIEPIAVDHSIPDATALAIETREGIAIHSGDFKIEDTFDEERFADFGRAGVSLLLSDSTNTDVESRQTSESGVEDALDALVARAKGRVVVSLFASNVGRMAAIARMAKRHHRVVVLAGRSMKTHVQIGEKLGLFAASYDRFLSPERATELSRERTLITATGSQGEPESALYKMAHAIHPTLALEPGDIVVMSSRVIPGNDREVGAIVDALLRRGVEVVTARDEADIHTSGHAARNEQLSLIELTEPRAFVPIHGTRFHLERHASLAREAGVGVVEVVENGTSIEWRGRSVVRGSEFPSGVVYRKSSKWIDEAIIDERKALAKSGIVWVFAGGNQRLSFRASGVSLDPTREAALAAEVRRAADETSVEPLEVIIRRAVRRVYHRAGLSKPEVIVELATVS